jgi:hypothetical protein
MKERTMTDNVTPFPNADEVIDEVEQEDRDYDAGYVLGAQLFAEARTRLEAASEGKSDSFDAGLWDGFYD